MNTNTEVFRNSSPTLGAELRCVFGGDSDYLPTSACCLEGKYVKESKPGYISHRPIKSMSRKESRHILMVDNIVFFKKLVSHLKMEVPFLVADLFVGFGCKKSGFRPALRALLPSGKSLLSHFENLKKPLKEAGVINLIPVGSGEKRLTTDINTNFMSHLRKGNHGNILTRERDIPLISGGMVDGNSLDIALNRTGELELKSANPADSEVFTFQLPSRLLKGERMIPMFGLESWEPSLFTCLNPAKECLVGLIQSLNNILKHLGADFLILGEGNLKGRKLFHLVKFRGGFTRFFEGHNSFLKGKIVELSAKKKPTRSILNCLFVGIDTILERLFPLHGLSIANIEKKGKPYRASPSIFSALKSGVLDGGIL